MILSSAYLHYNSSMQSDKTSKRAPTLAEQMVAMPETTAATETAANLRGENVASTNVTPEQMRMNLQSYWMSWLEAISTSPGERPVVLFNTNEINYVEIRSQLAGSEHCRVVFTNGSEYVLHDAERAGNFLRQLRERGIWQAVEAGQAAEPAAVATAAGG